MQRSEHSPLSFMRIKGAKAFVRLVCGVSFVFLLSLEAGAMENLTLPQGIQGLMGDIVELRPLESPQGGQDSQPVSSLLHPPPLKEEEPNNTLKEAQELVFGRDLEGSLQGDDVDIYRFSIDSPKQVAATLAFPKGSSGAALWFSILGPNGETLLKPSAVFPDFERVTLTYFLYPGTYYVQVGPMPYHGEGYTSPPYALYLDIRE